MGYSASQRKIIRTILKVGGRSTRGLSRSERATLLKSGIETGAVESGFSNPVGGDGTSSGWRQETSSSYPSVNRRNVKGAAARYFSEAKGNYRRGMRSGALAQATQRSAFPAKYQQHEREANRIVHGFLSGKGGKSSGGGGGKGGKAAGARYRNQKVSATARVPGTDNSALRASLLQQYALGGRNQKGALLSLAQGLKDAKDIPGASYTSSKNVKTQVSAGGGGKGAHGSKFAGKGGKHGKSPGHWAVAHGYVKEAGGADRPGVKTKPLTKFGVGRIAAAVGHPLTIGTGTNHNRMTTSGNVSDHWSGHAADIPASGKQLTRLGRAALKAYGQKPTNGGLHTFQWKGHRVQIIFNTMEGGNHYNHLHIGLQ